MDIFFQTAPSGAESIASFWQSTLGITVITLVAGLIGIILGQFLQGKSQHRAWLFEHRINAFGEFLKVFEECQKKAEDYAINISPDEKIDDKTLFIRLLKFFDPALTHLQIVRLLLDKSSRKEFKNSVWQKIKVICNIKNIDTTEAAERINKAEAEIQKIFENQLNYSIWLTRLILFFKRVFHLK